MPFAKVRLDAPSRLHEFAETPHTIYRGQGRHQDLTTSLERCLGRYQIPNDRKLEVEDELRREFRRTYHQYGTHVPDQHVTVEWLALMQHHGAPTRLLDFTYSVYIAAYFACESPSDADPIVWAVNAKWALQEASRLFLENDRLPQQVAALKAPFVEGSEAIVNELLFAKPYVALACPLNPFRLNERLRIQKGAFLAPGRIDIPFEENIGAMKDSDDRANVLKIVVPRGLAESVLKLLYNMNITRTSLFPGLDGYASSLGVYHPSFFTNGMVWKAVLP